MLLPPQKDYYEASSSRFSIEFWKKFSSVIITLVYIIIVFYYCKALFTSSSCIRNRNLIVSFFSFSVQFKLFCLLWGFLEAYSFSHKVIQVITVKPFTIVLIFFPFPFTFLAKVHKHKHHHFTSSHLLCSVVIIIK